MENTKEMTLQEIQEKLGCKIKIVDEKAKFKLATVETGKTFKAGKFEFVALEHFRKQQWLFLRTLGRKPRMIVIAMIIVRAIFVKI